MTAIFGLLPSIVFIGILLIILDRKADRIITLLWRIRREQFRVRREKIG